METTRRAMLVGFAGVVTGGCLSREPDPPSRTTVTEQTPPEPDDGDTGMRTPTVTSRQVSPGPDGNVQIDATIQNDTSSEFEGYLVAILDSQDRDVSARTRFAIDPLSQRTVSLTVPVDYEASNVDSDLQLSIRAAPLTKTTA